MTPILDQLTEAIARERSTSFRECFRLARALVDTYGEDRLADRLFDEIPYTVSWEIVADLLGILIWITKDDGAGITHSADDWLRAASDERKVHIALYLETFPFVDAEEMILVFSIVKDKFPDLKPRCDELIRERAKLQGDPVP